MSISTQMWFMSVLLVLSLNAAYWSNSKKEMFTLVTLVSLNKEAACWAAVKIISLICMKPGHMTFNPPSIFSLSL